HLGRAGVERGPSPPASAKGIADDGTYAVGTRLPAGSRSTAQSRPAKSDISRERSRKPRTGVSVPRLSALAGSFFADKRTGPRSDSKRKPRAPPRAAPPLTAIRQELSSVTISKQPAWRRKASRLTSLALTSLVLCMTAGTALADPPAGAPGGSK